MVNLWDVLIDPWEYYILVSCGRLLINFLLLPWLLYCILNQAVGSQPQEFWGWNPKLAPIHRGQAETEERDRPLQIGRYRFNKQENSHKRLVLGGHKMNWSSHLQTRILNVFVEALSGFNQYIVQMGLNHTLPSQGCYLEKALAMGTMGEMYNLMTEEGVRTWPMLNQGLCFSILHASFPLPGILPFIGQNFVQMFPIKEVLLSE